MLHTDEVTTDYVTETAEAMTLLEGAKPCIHAITSTLDLPGHGLYKMYQLDRPEDAKLFDGAEAWLLESRIIVAWYLFVPMAEE